ncbi:hypothetical protein A3762_02095 [Oleiphilus sp. HI0125]|uniref:hypothetical protein n=2 Tax=Oleiphilus sp. HI0125 TaxID=1822266 RepID=UPI0007C3C039|nr:hypothetical protein [Oleiphilus sp. HI0125]KZZ61685.1 hypothetical protein A3762_02095 [Oleiphilus sp. HI0125]
MSKRVKSPSIFSASITAVALLMCAFTSSANDVEFTSPSAKDRSSIPSEKQDSPTLTWLTENRNYWGHVVGDTAKRLDSFFADEEVIESSNNSFLKVGFEFQQYKSGHSYLDPIVKFRLHLPTLQKKLRLIVESETPEEQSVRDKKRAIGRKEDDKRVKDTASGALDFTLRNLKDFDTSTGVGVKLGDPIEPFWRYRLHGRYEFTDVWSVSSHDALYYYHDEGWGAHAEFTLQRQGPWFIFRQGIDGKYDHKERLWELAHTYSFLREIDSKRAINYQVGMLAETKPEVQATGYFVNAIYRRKLMKEWLFYEMIPEMYYPKEDNWKMDPSFTIKIEMVFSEKE